MFWKGSHAELSQQLKTAQLELDELKLVLSDREAKLADRESQLAKPHFVRDYVRLVDQLMQEHSLDEAMSIAVGGGYDEAGPSLVGVLRRCGLRDGMSLIDLGCGSGRVAKQLGLMHKDLSYLGLDIVPALLDYAAKQSPSHFRFQINHDLTLPSPDESVDIVFAFSVFTHLLHEESYIYLEEAKRVLKPGGRVVFSFLESGSNWPIFGAMVNNLRSGDKTPHLNMFTERAQIEQWASHLNLHHFGYDFAEPHAGFGQTVTMLVKN